MAEETPVEEVTSTYSAGLCYNLERRRGKVKILLMQVTDRFEPDPYWRLPGGTVEGVETPEETLERELAEELARDQDRFKRPRFLADPIHSFTNRDQTGPGKHQKFAYLVHVLDDDLRSEPRIDDDTYLNIPQWMEVDQAILLLEEQGSKTIFHLLAVIKGLAYIADRQVTVRNRYGELIKRYKQKYSIG